MNFFYIRKFFCFISLFFSYIWIKNNTIANELNISPRTLVKLVDQYGAKVAPLTEKGKGREPFDNNYEEKF